WSTPPIRFRSVVFPEPDGPMRATNSPSATVSETPSSTRTSSASRRYTLTTFCTSTDAMREPPGVLLRGQLHAAAAREGRRRRQHHGLAAGEPAPHLDPIPAFRTQRDGLRSHAAVFDPPHRRGAARRHDRVP